MSYPVWISTAAECPNGPPGNRDLDEGWQEIGILENTESDLRQVIQKRLGYRSTAPSAKGYVAAYLSEPWVVDVLGRHPKLRHGRGAAEVEDRFWLAVDVTSGAANPRFLITIRPAEFATQLRRQPEPHPGLLRPTVALPIRLRSLSAQVFR